MLKREAPIAIISLVVLALASMWAEVWGVEVDSAFIVSSVVVAIAALIRGETGVRKTDLEGK